MLFACRVLLFVDCRGSLVAWCVLLVLLMALCVFCVVFVRGVSFVVCVYCSLFVSFCLLVFV